VVTRLRDAGAIFIGQLNTYEFTFGGRPTFDALYPPARNPWDVTRSTGGSSSGSGAAVAAGFCLGALGSDAGGSIRTPSAFCGISGMKATFGRVSAFGDLPLSFSFDCVGPMTWTSEDSALMLQVLAGYDERDPSGVETPVPDYVAPLNDGVRGLKVGMLRHFYTKDFEAPPEIVKAIDGVGNTLRDLGATLGEINVSPLIDWHAVGRIILPAEAYAIHEENLQNRWEEFGPLARNRMMLGSLVRAVDYIQAQRRRTELLEEIETALAEYDVIITTAMLTPQPPLDDKAPFPFLDVPMIAVPFNLTLHPVQTVRAGFFDDGMPIGAQIVGRNWDEVTVLKVAHSFEKNAGQLKRFPDLN
jgi:aspartyl-tRNA(Asn)/glutamyl-tRNA(Gln) amidotransferase subunit A